MAPVATNKRGRPQSKPPTNPEKEAKVAPKKARVEEDAPVDPFSRACQEVLSLLDADVGLTDTARDMLRAAAPYSLKLKKEDRHKFQETFVTTLDGIIESVQGQEREKVEVVQGKINEASEVERMAADTLSQATGKLQDLTDTRDVADQAVKGASKAVAEAKKALESKKVLVQDIEAEHASNNGALTAREHLMDDVWAGLKSGTFLGRQWREKAKKIETIVKVLEELEVEASLLNSIPVALKAKPDDRGPFANKALEFVEESLSKSLQAMKDKISSHSQEVADHAGRVTEAEEALRAQTIALEERQNEWITSENDLLTATQEKDDAAQAVQVLADQSKELRSLLEDHQQSLAHAISLRSRFEAMATEGAAALEEMHVDLASEVR